tara:strand:- start:203 stop:460 length:258 start_codon:yes stop_codon:yes gene_type:complete
VSSKNKTSDLLVATTRASKVASSEKKNNAKQVTGKQTGTKKTAAPKNTNKSAVKKAPKSKAMLRKDESFEPGSLSRTGKCRVWPD